MSPGRIPWATMNSRTGNLECARCGESVPLALPMKLGTAAALMKAFAEAHEECEAQPSPAPVQAPAKCPKCSGEGKVADSDDQEPWSMWSSLPPGSNIAVLMGIVKPMACPRCNGSGTVQG